MITVQDLIKAKNGDLEAQTKMVEQYEEYIKIYGHYYNLLSVLNFKQEEVNDINRIHPLYEQAIELMTKYNQALDNGDIKLTAYSGPNKSQMKAWAKRNCPAGFRYEENFNEIWFGNSAEDGFGQIYLGETAHLDNSLTKNIVSNIFNEARKNVLDNDPLIKLHKEAMNMYDELRDCDLLSDYGFGYTTAGYRNQTSVTIWNKGNDSKTRLLTEGELKSFIEMGKAYLKRRRELEDELKKEFTFDY